MTPDRLARVIEHETRHVVVAHATGYTVPVAVSAAPSPIGHGHVRWSEAPEPGSIEAQLAALRGLEELDRGAFERMAAQLIEINLAGDADQWPRPWGVTEDDRTAEAIARVLYGPKNLEPALAFHNVRVLELLCRPAVMAAMRPLCQFIASAPDRTIPGSVAYRWLDGELGPAGYFAPELWRPLCT